MPTSPHIPHLLLLLIIALPTLTLAQLCTFTDGNGNSYDFSSLSKDQHWEVKEQSTDSGLFSVAYVFNFCNNIPKC
jgi:centromeric protein E